MDFKDRVSKDLLVNIIRAIPSNIFFKDIEQKYVFSSNYSEQLNLGDDEDIYGKTDREIRKSQKNLKLSEDMDREILETGTGRQYVIKSENDKNTKYIEIVKEPVRDETGNVIGIVGVMNDVTMATQEVANMLENEKAYQAAMRAGSFLAYNINLSNNILNDELKEFINGVQVNLLELVGMKAPCNFSEFITKWANKVLSPEDRQEFIDHHSVNRLISLYKNGQSEITKEAKMNIINIDGKSETVWMYESILLMQNVDKDIVAFVTLKDVTAERLKEKQLKKQLEDAVQEAIVANKVKDQFLANTSHEIRTPMNAVIGMSEVLLRDETDPQKIEYLKNIKAAGTHLIGIINNILDVTKIESGKFEIIPEVYEIRPRIELLKKLLNERAKEKNLELIMEVDDGLPKYMYGDAIRIRQVIINLVNNAIKFTEKGFVKLTVRVEEITDSEVTEYFCVEDTGIGIKEEEMDKLFGAFNRLDVENTSDIGGIGLGLALSKQLVELMGGHIHVESEYGVGTKFYFSIKQGIVKESALNEKDELKNKEENKEEPKHNKEHSGNSFKAPKAKVLVADDSAVNLKVFKALVSPLKINIDTAENGKIAVDMVKKNDYDLVFMDQMMPVMDGIEATKNIRKLDSKKHDMKIIALTANAVIGVKDQLLEAGMNDFISKPIRIKELLELLRKYLPEDYIEEINS